jgi:hypothetical protein
MLIGLNKFFIEEDPPLLMEQLSLAVSMKDIACRFVTQVFHEEILEFVW